jgi:hypothetical protein
MQYQEFLDWLSRAYHYTFTHDWKKRGLA